MSQEEAEELGGIATMLLVGVLASGRANLADLEYNTNLAFEYAEKMKKKTEFLHEKDDDV